MTLIPAVITTVVGLALVQPFFWLIVLAETHHPYMTFAEFMMIVGFVMGIPLFMFGIVQVLPISPVGGSSQADMDLARIRYETEKRK